MKSYPLLILVLLIGSLPVSALAGDYATLDFIGFSKNGRYLAFEEYGTQDGSGFPFATVHFIDVASNSYVGKPLKLIIEKETASESAVRSKAKLAAAKTLQSLKIVRGNTGTMVVARLITDLYDKEPEKSVDGQTLISFAEYVGSAYLKNLYDLRLKPIEAKTKDCEAYELPVYKFELSLTIDEKTSFLQKDSELPASRGCALNYRVQHVYLYDDYIVVFLNYETPGFEGPDMRFLAVSGKRERKN